MAQRKTLTEQQVSLLRWIADGCPDGVMSNDWYRISAAALKRRGLIRIRGRGPTWSASVTAAGREYLTAVEGSDPPIARQGNVSVTQQLVDDVIAAGGVLRVERKNYYDRDAIDYAYRARLAERYDKVPEGKRLVVDRTGGRELEIRLEDAPHRVGAPAELSPVPVPERVARYHPAVRRFRQLSEFHEVSRPLLPRAHRILHAVAREAECRGWTVDGSESGGLQITVDDCAFWVHIEEEGVRQRGRWEQEVTRYRDASRYWLSIDPDRARKWPTGPYDANASGRLKLRLGSEREAIFEGRQSRWADRKSWTLEERLPHLFSEIEERARKAQHHAIEQQIAAEQAAERARLAAEERDRTWHSLMAQAKERLVESHRVAVLRAQADAWHDAERLRLYCDAMDARHGQEPMTAEWLRWARAYTARVDPLTRPPRTPEPLEPTAEALQEHLPPGWSAQGPEHQQASRWH